MIPGFGGELIAHAYVEQELLPAADRERPLAQWWYRAARSLGPASSARAVMDVALAPLLRQLGYPEPAAAPHAAGLLGVIRGADATVIAAPWTMPPGQAWRTAMKGAARTSGWTVICNGRSLRVIDGSRPWSRKGVHFEFEPLMTSPRGVAALWHLLSAPALIDGATGALRAHVLASDAHTLRVCSSLGDGVLAALPALASALAPSVQRLHKPVMDQALTLIYRVLFLLYAEARGALPVWHDIYRDAYSIESLVRRSQSTGPRGLWPALQAVSRLAHAGCKAADLEVTAFNGRLFSPGHSPLVERRRVPDTIARDVLLALATERTSDGRRRISYHDLDVEQLGSVYERVLEYELLGDSRTTIRLSRTSAERKQTGSFYTPRALTEFLVRRTLAPLLEGKSLEQVLELRIVDPAMGSGAFLVAACRHMADHCEQALIEEGRWSAGDVTALDRASLRRAIAEQCLYGVDLNPTAVQLARLSLWLTTLAADRPLTFLDHHLAAGNSLLGARLSDLSRPPRVARIRSSASLPLFEDQLAGEVAAFVLPARARLALQPSDSLAAVRDKERALSMLSAPGNVLARWSMAANAWCAATLMAGPAPSSGLVAEWIAAATGGSTTLPAPPLQHGLDVADALARRHGTFHWELAFPEVFFDSRGRVRADAGFDAVLGNPPWDMLRADSGTPDERRNAKEITASVMRFTRSSGVYRLASSGHANRYQLFLERALQLAKPGGRIGLILPSGIGSDHGSAVLRQYLLDRTSIDTWIGFDNRRRIFPIHRSVRFVVLSTTNAGRTDVLTFRSGLVDPAALDADSPGAALSLSRRRLESWSPGLLAIPELRDARSLALLCRIVDRVPALGSERGWNMHFARELNATDDRAHFVERRGDTAALPIIEGKHLAPFRVALDRSTMAIPRKAATALSGANAFTHDRLAYRDVASATNRVTLIAAMLPAGVASTHTVFVSKTRLDDGSRWCLLGLLNSLVANYLARLQVTTHVTASLMARLPVPRPAEDSHAFARLASLARRLSATGIEGGVEDYAQLNAIAAGLYGMTVAEFEHILSTFPLIPAGTRATCLDRYKLLAQKPEQPG